MGTLMRRDITIVASDYKILILFEDGTQMQLEYDHVTNVKLNIDPDTISFINDKNETYTLEGSRVLSINNVSFEQSYLHSPYYGELVFAQYDFKLLVDLLKLSDMQNVSAEIDEIFDNAEQSNSNNTTEIQWSSNDW